MTAPACQSLHPSEPQSYRSWPANGQPIAGHGGLGCPLLAIAGQWRSWPAMVGLGRPLEGIDGHDRVRI